ncbi:MAG: ligase-associated DNA damage response endonuclease PdeM [Balneolales bacterium]|nr:ligase-associated DNA damage response endonuclease PdeM [Balneolales bacterium]
MKRNNDVEIVVWEQTLVLTSERALFWKEEQMLLVADVHLGKSGHFQKAGIPLPTSSNTEDLVRLRQLIDHFAPKTVLFLGDLFHSKKNMEWEHFRFFREEFMNVAMILVLGNHEILDEIEYQKLGLKTVTEFEMNPFLFVHDESKITSEMFVISGHVHPSVSMKGKGRQRVRVPCFYFSDHKGMLPAFGKFTGTFSIKPAKNDLVFGIIDHQILQL